MFPLKTSPYVKFEKDSILKTEKNSINLFGYLKIEKPNNNLLVIDAKEDYNTSQTYLFDFNNISFNSFHFYTRVYKNYYDFTCLKFVISNNKLTLFTKNDNRYEFGKISKVFNKVN